MTTKNPQQDKTPLSQPNPPLLTRKFDIAIWSTSTLLYTTIFLPLLYLFSQSIEHGMRHVDRLYPYPQPRKPLYDNPFLIYTHIYGNILALGLLLALLVLNPPRISKGTHSLLAYAYVLCVTVGTVASVFYAFRQRYGSEGGKAGVVAFGVMAGVTFYTMVMALYFVLGRKDTRRHREWALRNFAVLSGNGIVFRVLANTYLVEMRAWGAEFYAAWCQMIYLSWAVPLVGMETYLSLSSDRS